MTNVKDKDGNIVASLELNPDSYYRFEVDTLWGAKEYELKPTYHFVTETHTKDYSKPSGMVLTKA
jgi:hypothetical protein